MSASDPTPPAVVTEERGTVAIIRLNRPAARNPLSVQTLSELYTEFSLLASRADVSAVVFTGAGDVFASGADVRELRRLTPSSALSFARTGQELFRKIAGARPLTIAAVNGYCMGGGLDLALSCHVRLASPAAVFAHPGARLGIITGWGGTQRLRLAVGAARAFEMFLTARRVSGAEALEMGLVSGLCDPVLEGALSAASGV